MAAEDQGPGDPPLAKRAEDAVDRSRNLRQLITLQRLLRELARRRRAEAEGLDDGPDSPYHA